MNTIEAPPTLRALTGGEIQTLLERNCVGRIAYSLHDRVDIEPVHYAYDGPWVVGRTSAGAKLLTLAHNRWCAFEIDEVQSLFDWQSVVVKGPFTPLDAAENAEDYARAVSAFRRLLPSALTDADPAPHRDVVFRIHASEVSGRCSVSNGTQRWAVPAAR